MFKKILVIGGGATLAAFLLFGTSAASHVKHGVSWIQGKVHDSVPVEYELERARELIDDTGPEIEKVQRVIAEKQVEMKYLELEIDRIEDAQAQNKQALKLQAARLDEGKSHYRVGRRLISRAAYESDASRRLDRVRSAAGVLTSKREHLDALHSTLSSAHRRLEELKVQRERLMAKVAAIEAKMQEAEAKKALTLDIDVDTSSLAKANGILSDLNKRLDVELQVMENNKPLLDEVEVEDIDTTSVQDRISAYLGASEGGSEAFAVTEGDEELVEVRQISVGCDED